MTKHQPEALRLADWCRTWNTTAHNQVEAELRRLYAINADLLEALQILFDRANRNSIDPFALQQAEQAIAKSTGEIK
jgi:hypothetical protein